MIAAIRSAGPLAVLGDGTALEDRFAFGQVVTSATGRVVVSARDDMPEETPFQPPRVIRRSDDYGGNHVIVRVRPGASPNRPPASRWRDRPGRGGRRIHSCGRWSSFATPACHVAAAGGPRLPRPREPTGWSGRRAETSSTPAPATTTGWTAPAARTWSAAARRRPARRRTRPRPHPRWPRPRRARRRTRSQPPTRRPGPRPPGAVAARQSRRRAPGGRATAPIAPLSVRSAMHGALIPIATRAVGARIRGTRDQGCWAPFSPRL
jgi:hypothetical protein